MTDAAAEFIVAVEEMMITFSQGMRRALRRNQLTIVQFIVLKWLASGIPTSMATLAEFLDARPQTATSIAESLERRGWAVRERSSTDRRELHLKITPQGQAWMHRMDQAQHRFMRRKLVDVPDDELRAAARGLARARAAFARPRAPLPRIAPKPRSPDPPQRPQRQTL